MKFIDVCAGIGGFSLGLERAGMRAAAQIEIDKYCTKILERHWPDVPKFGDIKDVKPEDLPEIELIAGGYPCQPFSEAGKRKGPQDDRHLWPYIIKIIKEKRPNWCLFENVNGHVSLGLDRVLSDLEKEAYAARAFIIPACSVGAPHRRDRVFILAHTKRQRQQKFYEADALPIKLQSFKTPRQNGFSLAAKRIYRLPDSESIRRGHGLPQKLDRIKALGNAVVPQIVEILGRTILAANNEFERGNIDVRNDFAQGDVSF